MDYDAQIRLQEESLHVLKGMKTPYKLKKQEAYSAYSPEIWHGNFPSAHSSWEAESDLGEIGTQVRPHTARRLEFLFSVF